MYTVSELRVSRAMGEFLVYGLCMMNEGWMNNGKIFPGWVMGMFLEGGRLVVYIKRGNYSTVEIHSIGMLLATYVAAPYIGPAWGYFWRHTKASTRS